MKANKILYLVLTAFMALLICPSASYATNGIELIGFGPIQRSMGGASVGLPLDSGTIMSNPAGMSDAGGCVDLGLTIAFPHTKYRAYSAAGLVTENNRTLKSDTPPFLLPGFGIILPVTKDKNLAVGVGAYPVSGVGVDYDTNLYNNVTYVKYTCFKIAPAVSYSFFDDFIALGASANFDYATLGYHAALATNPAHDDTAAFGFGFTTGILCKPLALLELDKIPEDLLAVGVTYQSEQWFTEFVYNTTSGKDRLELNQPQSVAVGIGLKPFKRFRMGFDIKWIDWSQILGSNKPNYRENASGSSLWNVNWNDQVVFKIGGEWDIIEKMLIDKLTLRAGYNYGKHPLPKDRPFETIGLPAIAEHHITCGLGIGFTENVVANVGFLWAPEVSFDTGNSGSFIDSANIKTSQYSIDMGISYRF